MTIPRFAIAAGLLAVAGAVSAQTSGTKTYIVQLADAPAATYTGTVSGLAATRPAPGSTPVHRTCVRMSISSMLGATAHWRWSVGPRCCTATT